MNLLKMATVATVVLVLGPSVPAFAQDKSPPSWPTLVRCAEKGDPTEELACYRAAMREAGYAPTPEANAQRRSKFGLSPPSVGLAKRPNRERPHETTATDDDDKVTVQLEQLALIPPANKMMFVTTDGAIWQQLDNDTVTPRPKPGQSFQIERNGFGGYFCRFDRLTKVRCARTH